MMDLGEKVVDSILDMTNTLNTFPDDMFVMYCYGRMVEDNALQGGMELKSPNPETMMASMAMMMDEYPPLMGAVIGGVYEKCLGNNNEYRTQIIALLESVTKALIEEEESWQK